MALSFPQKFLYINNFEDFMTLTIWFQGELNKKGKIGFLADLKAIVSCINIIIPYIFKDEPHLAIFIMADIALYS